MWSDFTDSDCQGADFGCSNLKYVCFQRTNLKDANLLYVKNLTAEQLSEAYVDETTTLPDNITFSDIQEVMLKPVVDDANHIKENPNSNVIPFIKFKTPD